MSELQNRTDFGKQMRHRDILKTAKELKKGIQKPLNHMKKTNIRLIGSREKSEDSTSTIKIVYRNIGRKFHYLIPYLEEIR